LGGFPALDEAHVTRLDKINGLDFTEPDTLRLAVTEVALEDPPVDGIITHGTEWADADACAATDAGIIVNADAAHFLIF
jgi:hypothetical protein